MQVKMKVLAILGYWCMDNILIRIIFKRIVNIDRYYIYLLHVCLL